MRNLFRSKFKETQPFKANPQYYKQFGLLGHEGGDYTPTGTVWDVLALEDGIVVLDDDAVGSVSADPYGKIVTLWHPKINKATMYCHLSENFVTHGQTVKRGDKIGVMGSTGNSTGAHVHLNLFETDGNGVRLNRNNGYLGGIDPLPFLNENVDEPQDALTECLRLHGEAVGTIEKELKPRIAELEGLLKDRDSAIEGLKGEKKSFEDFQLDLAKTLNCNNQQSAILGEIKTLISQEDRMNQAEGQIQDLQTQLTKLTAERDTLTADQSSLKAQLLETQSVAKVALQNESKALKELEKYKVGNSLIPIWHWGNYYFCTKK